MAALHKPDEIFSARHLPTWLMLTFAAGCVNATTFVACARFVTHPSTDLGIHLVELAYVKGEARRNARRHALLRAGKIAAFIAGGAAGVTLARSAQFLTFLLPAVVVLAATVISFVSRRESPSRQANRPPPSEPLMSGTRTAR